MDNFKPLANRIRELARLQGMSFVQTEILDDREVKELADALFGIKEELVKFDLDAAIDHIERTEYLRHPDKAIVHYSTLNEGLKTLLDVMIGQLGRRYYVPVPTDVADFYEKPESKFPLSMVMFPSCAEDIREAGRCFALERYTACVFHAMGILQVGLYALADECKVRFPFKIELADWENVIAGIEKYIKDIHALPKSDHKDADLKFYSSLATQFRYFKNAWRNHVAHLREEYDKDQAHSILIHVRDFMEQAATRLKEVSDTAP
jgi:hypothetical protein